MLDAMEARAPKRVRLIKGHYFWRVTPAVRAMGFISEPLGADPVVAYQRAADLNAMVEAEVARAPGIATRKVAQARRERDTALLTRYKAMVQAAKRRAKARDAVFSLTPTDVDGLLERAAGRCQLTGIPFDMSPHRFHKNPFTPSLDRIDCREGYTASNTRVVLAAVNLALSEWGEALFSRLAFAYVEKAIADFRQGGQLR